MFNRNRFARIPNEKDLPKDVKKKNEEVKKNIEMAKQAAIKCLKNEDFKKYKKAYYNLEKSVHTLFVSVFNAKAMNEAFFLYLKSTSNLVILSQLLRGVEADSKQKAEE